MLFSDWSSEVCSADLHPVSPVQAEPGERLRQAGDLPGGFGPACRLPVVAMLAPQKGGVPVLTRTGKEHRHQIRKILEAPDHALPLPPRHSASATPDRKSTRLNSSH